MCGGIQKMKIKLMTKKIMVSCTRKYLHLPWMALVFIFSAILVRSSIYFDVLNQFEAIKKMHQVFKFQ